MIELVLQRRPTVKDTTLGVLFLDGLRVCDTLEDAVRPAKVHGRTAIPAGRYRLELVDSPRFGYNTLSLKDVPGFQYIRIHAGNDDQDTEGCLLVGTAQPAPDDGGNVVRSRLALVTLKALVIPGMLEGEEAWIDILPAPTF